MRDWSEYNGDESRLSEDIRFSLFLFRLEQSDGFSLPSVRCPCYLGSSLQWPSNASVQSCTVHYNAVQCGDLTWHAPATSQPIKLASLDEYFHCEKPRVGDFNAIHQSQKNSNGFHYQVDGVKITFAIRDEGRRTEGGSLFSSDGPCKKCKWRVVNKMPGPNVRNKVRIIWVGLQFASWSTPCLARPGQCHTLRPGHNGGRDWRDSDLGVTK